MVVSILTIVQMVLGVCMIISVMLQQQGSGLGATFGGTGSTHMTRRGADLFLYRATIVLSILFFGISLAIVIL